VVCTLGVVEVTAREHFSGYRSHAMLLAAIPAVAVEVIVVVAVGAPGQRRDRALMLLAVVPVFGVLFWLLRKRFRPARQARVGRGAPSATHLIGGFWHGLGNAIEIGVVLLCSRSLTRRSRHPRQPHREHGAASGSVGRANRAAVLDRDLADDRQAEAAALGAA